MRTLRFAPLLLTLLSPTLWAQDLAPTQWLRMPRPLAHHWLCSLKAPRGWEQPGYDSRAWSRPVVVPGRYPADMEPEEQALYNFIWHAGGGHTGKPVYFRRTVTLTGLPVEAAIRACVDDQFTLYANGVTIGHSKAAHEAASFDVKLKRGDNVIAIEAKDVQPPGYGLLVAPQITQTWPIQPCDWYYSANGRTHWRKAASDVAPPIALQGLKPYKCITVPGGMKDFSTAYFRRTLGLDGLPLEANAVVLADDGYELYVNGKLVTLEKRAERAYIPRKADLLPFLHRGNNTILVKVTNDWGPGRMYCVPTVTMTF